MQQRSSLGSDKNDIVMDSLEDGGKIEEGREEEKETTHYALM